MRQSATQSASTGRVRTPRTPTDGGDTLSLRALAAVLIVNSHLEAYYPVGRMAADGLLGDSLFFFLSGLGLSLSEAKGRRPFREWFGRRLSRLYPALVVTVIAFHLILDGGWRSWGASDYALNLGLGGVWYPFIGQIVTFYFLYFLIVRGPGPGAVGPIGIALGATYGLVPWLGRVGLTFHGFHWVFYFQMMLLGAWAAGRAPGRRRDGFRFWGGLAALGGAYLGLRATSGMLGRDWFFLPHLLLFPIALGLLDAARSPRVARVVSGRPGLTGLIGVVGGVTLELYLMHYQVLRVDAVRRLAFPLNVIALFGLSILAALVLAKLVGLGRRVFARLSTIAEPNATRFPRLDSGNSPYRPKRRGSIERDAYLPLDSPPPSDMLK